MSSEKPTTQEFHWKPYPRAGRNPVYRLASVLIRGFLRFYARTKVVGLENVPRTGGVLLASNHASYIDPILIGGALYRRRRVWMMGKSEMWENRLFGWVNDRVMGFPVKRNSPDRAIL